MQAEVEVVVEEAVVQAELEAEEEVVVVAAVAAVPMVQVVEEQKR